MGKWSDTEFEDYLTTVFSAKLPPLPEPVEKIGACNVAWEEIDPGVVRIKASGGSIDDRSWAEGILRDQLSFFGYERAQLTIESATKEAHWSDIMAKAKRLIQSGQVTILRNGVNNVAGHVVGDHGEYDTEISRDDPNSRAISLWSCTCPWNDYSWGRSRDFKKYEGRPCHLPGSMITMADGSFKKIEDVKEGESVITHNGTGRIRTMMARPYQGSAYSIHRMGFPHPIRVTENHEIWAVETPTSVRQAAYNQPPKNEGQGFRIYDDAYVSEEPLWIDAQNLKVHDWVASTWSAEENESASLPMATILGYYLAEGSLAKRTSGWYETQFCFHEDEVELHQDLYAAIEAIGLKHRTYRPKGRKCVDIRITGAELANTLYDWGGHMASNKRLSSDVMGWSSSLLEEVLRTYSLGDGDMKPDGRQALNTSSDTMARQLYDVLVKCGYIPSWTIRANNGGPQNRSGRTTINRIQFKWDKKDKANGRRRYESRYMSKITKIEEEWYDGLVFNMSVDDQESYVAEGVTNHNCSHTLALFWKSLSTPLDDYDPDTHGPMPGQKKGPSGAPIPGPPGNPPPDAVGGPPSPSMPETIPSPAEAPLAAPPEVLPPSPAEQFAMAQPPMPGSTPSGMPAPPNSVSVPGARPPTPFGPIQLPGGTYSKVAAEQYNNGDIIRLNQATYGLSEGRAGATDAGQYMEIPQNSQGEVISQDPSTGWIEAIFPLKGGAMTSYHCRLFLEQSEVSRASGSPMVKRRV